MTPDGGKSNINAGSGARSVPACAKCKLSALSMEWHPADDRQCCPQCGTRLWWKEPGAEKVVPMAGAFGSQVGGDHYRELAIQPAEYAQRNGLGFMEGCVVKYVTRHRRKNGAEDIRKAIHFLHLLLEVEYPEAAEPETGTR